MQKLTDYPDVTLTPVNPANSKFSAYHVKTARSEYFLVRNQPRPNMLFSVKGKGFGMAKIKGFSWFKEIDGEIFCCS
jgi:hypothetical protein